MEELVELVRTLNLTKMKSNGIWDYAFEPGSKMEALCEGIYSGKIKSDEQAIAMLYAGEQVGSKLHNLKDRLRDRLINLVLLMDLRNTPSSTRQEAYLDCNKKWAAAMTLISKGSYKSSIPLLEDTLKTCIYYEFTELSLNILSALRLHYGTIYGDQQKFRAYREMYEKYREVWKYENMAEDLYADLTSQYVAKKATQKTLGSKAEDFYEQLAPHMQEYSSFRLHLCGRLLEMIIYTSQNDYQTTAAKCLEALEFFSTKPYESRIPQQAFYYQLIVCYIQLRDFEKGEEVIRKYQSVFEEGSFNWYKLQELFFMLSMYTQHYQSAFNVYNTVSQKLKTGNPPPQIVEMWKIYEAYTYFLIHMDKVKTPGEDFKNRFKLAKFRNEVSMYSRDKQGMNIPILVIQILFSISEHNYYQSIDQIEAIEKYCSRYLKKDETFRSNCFIKALLQIPAASFHKEAVIRKSAKYINQLREKPLEVANQTYEIEIIPYEDLWEMAIGILDNKLHQLHKGTGSNKGSSQQDIM